MIQFYNNTSNKILVPSATLILSSISIENNDYAGALDWLKKGEKIKSNSFYENMIVIEKAKLYYKMGKKQDFNNLINAIFQKDNLSGRQKVLVEELFSLNDG